MLLVWKRNAADRPRRSTLPQFLERRKPARIPHPRARRFGCTASRSTRCHPTRRSGPTDLQLDDPTWRATGLRRLPPRRRPMFPRPVRGLTRGFGRIPAVRRSGALFVPELQAAIIRRSTFRWEPVGTGYCRGVAGKLMGTEKQSGRRPVGTIKQRGKCVFFSDSGLGTSGDCQFAASIGLKKTRFS